MAKPLHTLPHTETAAERVLANLNKARLRGQEKGPRWNNQKVVRADKQSPNEGYTYLNWRPWDDA